MVPAQSGGGHGGWQEPGGRPGEKRVGGVWKAGEEGREAGEKGKKLHNIVQYSTIRKMQRGGNQQNTGQEGVREAGGLNPPVPLSSAEVR